MLSEKGLKWFWSQHGIYVHFLKSISLIKVFITYPCSLYQENETLLITKALSEQKRLERFRLMKEEGK